MRAQVIENDDVARVEARCEPVTNEADEPWAVHGAVERLVRKNAIGAHSSDDADVLTPIGGATVDH